MIIYSDIAIIDECKVIGATGKVPTPIPEYHWLPLHFTTSRPKAVKLGENFGEAISYRVVTSDAISLMGQSRGAVGFHPRQVIPRPLLRVPRRREGHSEIQPDLYCCFCKRLAKENERKTRERSQ
ncbi:hypothetical protein CC2G_005681 [Coprinopsis cinerea AmutBmut pab1-1]|nr:hypothetical protein CC2G_005681 [Coprinopsis cinerea AmutBmut pab1-1]